MTEYMQENAGKTIHSEDERAEHAGESFYVQESDERGMVKAHKETKGDSFISFLKELPVLVITAVAIAFVIKWLVLQPFYIPSQSMEPTLIPQDRVLVSKFIYRFTEPQPGDIVVFVAPQGDGRDFIKRVVATEGDTVEVRDGELLVNGAPTEQNFETMPGDYSDWGPERVRTNHVFVMGDNRPNSLDSRYFGHLPEENILGKAFMVYWPLDRIKLLN